MWKRIAQLAKRGITVTFRYDIRLGAFEVDLETIAPGGRRKGVKRLLSDVPMVGDGVEDAILQHLDQMENILAN